jgi:elongation of very long chain fatty acids protein 4
MATSDKMMAAGALGAMLGHLPSVVENATSAASAAPSPVFEPAASGYNGSYTGEEYFFSMRGAFYDKLVDGYGLEFLPEYNGWLDTATLAALPVGYLLTIGLTQRWMADRKPFQLKAAMRVYNVIQVLLCAYMSVGLLLSPLLDAPALPAILGLRLPNLFAIGAPYTPYTEWFVLVHYWSKFLDLLDTCFIILRKKDEQLSFLHVYHHASIGVMWGIVLRSGNGNGTGAYGAFINSVIHVLMYSHYLITSFGVRNPLKKYLTAAQICQFYSCVAHALLVVLYIAVGWETSVPKQLAVLQVGYHFSMIALFSAFYRRKFAANSRKAKSV